MNCFVQPEIFARRSESERPEKCFQCQFVFLFVLNFSHFRVMFVFFQAMTKTQHKYRRVMAKKIRRGEAKELKSKSKQKLFCSNVCSSYRKTPKNLPWKFQQHRNEFFLFSRSLLNGFLDLGFNLTSNDKF